MPESKTITTEELLMELQALDPRLTIAPNQNRPGVSNVFLNGVDICPWVPSAIIQEEPSPTYVYKLPNDSTVPLKTHIQIVEIVKLTLERLKDPKEAEIIFDTSFDKDEESKLYGAHTI